VSEEPREREPTPPIGADSIPGLARVAASTAWNTTGWAVQTYVSIGRRLFDVALHPEHAVDLAADLRRAARDVAGNVVTEDTEQRVRQAAKQNPVTHAVANAVPTVAMPAETKAAQRKTATRRASADTQATGSLPEIGTDLLRRSNDVWLDEEAHPAYERIVSELAPDEARILRLLLKGGPQPSVDVRTGGPLGLLSSHLIAPGLNMIGPRAGLRHVERVPQYLNNLFRLGLVWFSRETLRDPHEYQVVEAQPDVLAAMHSVRQAKIVRRSVHLTPFGEDFCRVALSLKPEELQNLPEHSDPGEDRKAAAPPADH